MSSNRFSEIWQGVKPFALKDLSAKKTKNTDGGASGYYIILYDQSSQKLRYYSMSAAGMEAAINAAESGDVIFLPAGTIVNNATTAYSLGNVIETGAIPVTSTVGVKVSGLQIGQWYALEAFNGPFYLQGATEFYKDWAFTADNNNIANYDYIMGYINYWDNKMFTAIPPWAAHGEAVDSHYYRMYWQATTTDIWVRNADAMCDDNSPLGTLSYRLWNAIKSNPIIIPAGVEVVGLGENSVIDGNIENNGILTNLKVTGTISGSGTSRMISNAAKQLFSRVIKSSVVTGTAPLEIASTTKVDNLNADLLDGYHASDFAPSGSVGGGVDVLGTPTAGHLAVFVDGDTIEDGGAVPSGGGSGDRFVDKKELPANQTVTSLVDLSSLSITFTPESTGNYIYLITLSGYKASGTGTTFIYLTDGSNTLIKETTKATNSDWGDHFSFIYSENLTGEVEVTRKLRAYVDAGSFVFIASQINIFLIERG